MSAKVLANLFGWEKTFKDVDIPNLEEIIAQKEQRKAIAGNIEALPESTQLAAGINKFNFDQLLAMHRAATPYYDEIMQTGGKQITSMLRGELPEDVQNSIMRSRGAKSFAGGYAGSGAAGAAEAQSLGLASLDLIREGLSSSERWLQSAASRLPQLADASSMFISPTQQISHATSERNNRWNFDMLKAQQAAMPTGTERALTGLSDWVEDMLASAATMGVSGAMGGGGSMTGGGGASLTKQDMTLTTRGGSAMGGGGWGGGVL